MEWIYIPMGGRLVGLHVSPQDSKSQTSSRIQHVYDTLKCHKTVDDKCNVTYFEDEQWDALTRAAVNKIQFDCSYSKSVEKLLAIMECKH